MGRCQTLPGACPSEALIRPLMKCNITSDLQQRLALPPTHGFKLTRTKGSEATWRRCFWGSYAEEGMDVVLPGTRGAWGQADRA